MMERGAGHVVTIASAAGLTATVRQSDYAASKHAAVGFDESLRCELRYLGYDDIRTTVVCPYYIATGMFEGAKPSSPLLPVASPERTASQIVDSIARGRRRLFLPPLLALSYLGRLLTTDLFDASMRTLGVPRSMDAFTGRALGRES
jgi:all-trans-retinol dehydrogenase (NAD+)